ncbi:hypothetical protein B0H14DRAFT_3855700 [Mycena olivaceomarginata]|nr:hypothetical protein B0H14DRAFT_3855700 [Mycena olivaceomarginata]
MSSGSQTIFNDVLLLHSLMHPSLLPSNSTRVTCTHHRDAGYAVIAALSIVGREVWHEVIPLSAHEHQHEPLVAPPPPTPKHELDSNFGGHPLPSAAAPLTLAVLIAMPVPTPNDGDDGDEDRPRTTYSTLDSETHRIAIGIQTTPQLPSFGPGPATSKEDTIATAFISDVTGYLVGYACGEALVSYGGYTSLRSQRWRSPDPEAVVAEATLAALDEAQNSNYELSMMKNVLVLTLCLLLPTPLASPVVTTGSASASAAVLNPAGVPNSDSSSAGLLPLPVPITAPNPVSSAFDDDFVLYTKYSSAAYRPFCPRPVGRTLVRAVRVVSSAPFSFRSSLLVFMAMVGQGESDAATLHKTDAVTQAQGHGSPIYD